MTSRLTDPKVTDLCVTDICYIFHMDGYLGPKPLFPPACGRVEYVQLKIPENKTWGDEYYPEYLPRIRRELYLSSAPDAAYAPSITRYLLEHKELQFERKDDNTLVYRGVIVHPDPFDGKQNDKHQYCDCCYKFIVTQDGRGNWLCCYCDGPTRPADMFQWHHSELFCIRGARAPLTPLNSMILTTEEGGEEKVEK